MAERRRSTPTSAEGHRGTKEHAESGVDSRAPPKPSVIVRLCGSSGSTSRWSVWILGLHFPLFSVDPRAPLPVGQCGSSGSTSRSATTRATRQADTKREDDRQRRER